MKTCELVYLPLSLVSGRVGTLIGFFIDFHLLGVSLATVGPSKICDINTGGAILASSHDTDLRSIAKIVST